MTNKLSEKIPFIHTEDSHTLLEEKKSDRGRKNVASVPSWGKITFAFVLFFLMFSTPVIYWAVRGEVPLYLVAFLGLGFPVLLWAVLILNRRLFKNLQTGRREANTGKASPKSREV